MVFELATLGPSMILLAVILFLLIIGLIVFLFVFWILMIIDAAKRKFKNDNDRVIWILIIVLLGMLGAIIYYFAIKMPDKHWVYYRNFLFDIKKILLTVIKRKNKR